MYERNYGYRYTELGEYPTTAEIAKAIRADIKTAISEGLLPGKPVTYSVRSDNFAGGCSVDIEVRDWPEAWQDCTGTVPGSETVHEHNGQRYTSSHACPDVWCAGRNDPAYAHAAKHHKTLTADARAAHMTLERIHGAYNHDGSEIQVDYFDVRYYGHVRFESPDSAEWRRNEKAKAQAKRRALTEALDGPRWRIANYNRKGGRIIHDAVQVDGKWKLVCGAVLWGGGFTSNAEGCELTCSRCAKKAQAS